MTRLLRSFKYLLVLIILVPFLFLSKDVFGVEKVTIKKSQISKVVEFKIDRKHSHPQGGVITEKYYVFSNFNGKDKSTNYVYIVNRKNGKDRKMSVKSFGHMNTFAYDWGKNEVRIMSSGAHTVGCVIKLDGEIKDIKIKGKDYKCASKVPPDISIPSDEFGKNKTDGGTWRPQGRGKWGEYVMKIRWNDNRGKPDRHDAMIYVYKDNGKKLAKVFFIPTKVIKSISGTPGEIEDISFDANGDVYLLYAGYSGTTVWKGVTRFYKIKRSVFVKHGIKLQDLTKDENKNDKDSSKDKDKDKPNNTKDDPNNDDKDNPSNNKDDPNKNKDNSNNDGGSSGSEEDDCAIILTDFCDDSEKGVENVLNLILDILTYGVSIAAIIGISISGITYLTAKGNEQQTIKAKRRIYEIVIGLVVYAALYALLKFLKMA